MIPESLSNNNSTVDRSALLEWLREQVRQEDEDIFSNARILPFGSHELFGSGADRDFMVCIDHIPAELRELVPPPIVDPAYQEPFRRMQDVERGFDFLICEAKRVAEFRFAMNALAFMKYDRPTAFEALRYQKELRVGVFRMARFCAPDSELIQGDRDNPGIDGEEEDPDLR